MPLLYTGMILILANWFCFPFALSHRRELASAASREVDLRIWASGYLILLVCKAPVVSSSFIGRDLLC